LRALVLLFMLVTACARLKRLEMGWEGIVYCSSVTVKARRRGARFVYRTVDFWVSSERIGEGRAREASISAALSGWPYVGFAFLGDGGVGPDASLAVRFLDTRFAAFRTWRASLSSEKMVLRLLKSDLAMSDALCMLV
jgi:hypothetical protein